MILVEVCETIIQQDRGLHLDRIVELDETAGSIERFAGEIVDIDILLYRPTSRVWLLAITGRPLNSIVRYGRETPYVGVGDTIGVIDLDFVHLAETTRISRCQRENRGATLPSS